MTEHKLFASLFFSKNSEERGSVHSTFADYLVNKSRQQRYLTAASNEMKLGAQAVKPVQVC